LIVKKEKTVKDNYKRTGTESLSERNHGRNGDLYTGARGGS